ncbi:hypothetical protein [uncultured Mycobacterium sp.]|uniref:DUF7065 domain-containing protein n=1 Tax=uncultured Mycobacterium sp. TaxID=171292 RepID=UPI0035CA2D7E
MTIEHGFGPQDDALHPSGDSHYETETFWYSFLVPERRIGAWVYASVRHNAGVTSGGMWVWDDSAVHPIDSPFYEYFAHLKPPAERGPQVVAFPTGMRIEVRQPLMSYDISYADRARMDAQLRFEALEPPVPLRTGEPPYPKAHHFDQTGHVTGTVTLDDEPIVVDCFAMRDRSWGPRPERGYRRVGYTWAAGMRTSLLTYTAPAGEGAEHIYSGYLRRDNRVSRIANGHRQVERHPVHGWVSAITVDAYTEDGDRVRGRAEAVSRLLLAISNHVCACTLLAWELDGESLAGEDQDVWPIPQWRLLRAAGRRAAGQT